MISTAHSQKVALTVESHRMNSTKHLQEAKKIQHLVRIRFDTRISINLTEEGRTELYAVYQESFDKGHIPEDWTHSVLKPISK